jgi:hypothetical protein
MRQQVAYLSVAGIGQSPSIRPEEAFNAFPACLIGHKIPFRYSQISVFQHSALECFELAR